jgi:hypothetical protein
MRSLGFADSLIYRTVDLGEVKAGDSVSSGPFVWSTTTRADTLVNESKKVTRLSGTVLCKNGNPCADVEVMTIVDIYGFGFVEGDSTTFVAQAKTDSMGRWWLPVPDTLPGDSFRVEFRKQQDDIVTQVGVSRYVGADEIKDLKDTLVLDTVTLSRPSALVSGVTLVVDREDTTQSSNCMVNSVVVGIKGTSHFVREVTCNMIKLSNLPGGSQEIVLYSGDPKVMSTLRHSNIPAMYYVTLTAVSLPEEDVLEQQWLTYTPPSQNILE